MVALDASEASRKFTRKEMGRMRVSARVSRGAMYEGLEINDDEDVEVMVSWSLSLTDVKLAYGSVLVEFKCGQRS